VIPTSKSFLSNTEIQTLLQLARHPNTQIAAPPGAGFDFSRIVRSVIGGDLAGFFLPSLSDLGLSKKDQRFMSAIALQTEVENRIYRTEAVELCATAQREGLCLVPLKGAALLIEDTYPDLSCRKMCDIDLLTPRDSLDAMRGFLLRMGYRDCSDYQRMYRYSRSLLFRKEVEGLSIPVELHWSAFLEMAPSRKLDRAVLSRLRQVEVDGHPLFLLAPEDHLLSMAIHLALHRYRIRLKWLLDLSRYHEQCSATFDWPLFWQNTASLGANRAVNYSLYLAKELLESSVQLAGPPSETLKRCCPPFALLENRAYESWPRRLAVDLLLRDSLRAGLESWFQKGAELVERHSPIKMPSLLVRRDPRQE
jgi:hypothetical protein